MVNSIRKIPISKAEISPHQKPPLPQPGPAAVRRFEDRKIEPPSRQVRQKASKLSTCTDSLVSFHIVPGHANSAATCVDTHENRHVAKTVCAIVVYWGRLSVHVPVLRSAQECQ